MKLTKGKKQDEKEKKKAQEAGKIPGPPLPVRIQVEPRKASTVSLEVKAEEKPNPVVRKKSTGPEKAPTPSTKPAKSIEISTSKERRRTEDRRRQESPSIVNPRSGKNQPSVTVSIFDSAAPAPAKKKPMKARKQLPNKEEKEKAPIISKLSRPERYQTPSSISISDSSGTVTEADLKFMRDFIARSGYLDNQVAEVRIGLSKITKLVDVFTEKVNSVQKDMGELKVKMASLKEWKIEKDVSEVKERADEIEAVLEKMSEKFREYKGESEKSAASDAKKMKSVSEDISGLKAGVKELRTGMSSLNTELTKLGDFKAFVQGKAQEPQKEAAPDIIKNMSDRFDTFDSRIAGITERIVKLSEDMQKLTSYFMEGIKHMESRIRVIENENEAQERMPIPKSGPEPKFIPSTYLSHLKMEPEPDLDADDYDIARRRTVPAGPRLKMPQPPPAQPQIRYTGLGTEEYIQPAQTTSFPRKSAAKSIPAMGPPPAPAPERGNMFTKLREATVVRMPIPQEDPDLDIITEHIRESMQKQESREKITRDLMNAGFEQDLINQAFMRSRVG